MPTPHNNAKYGDFAKTVLMPGDPLRAKFVAENFLTDAVLVNNVRGINGYTGFFEGKKISVMASGMGMPSIAIYAQELYESYGVETIIRIGSAGGLAPQLKLRDIVLAQAASTDSNFIKTKYSLSGQYSPVGDFDLLVKAKSFAEQHQKRVFVGNILSSDVFYASNSQQWQKMGVLAVEMECAALYAIAAEFSKKALCICTISDKPLTGESLPADQRQNSFADMIQMALSVAE